MATRKRLKVGARKRPSPSKKALLEEGDWLDVMDGDGVWNVARVLSVPSPEEVEITYDGWPEEYDEVVRVDSNRVAPFHTFTWAVKCWVKYLNWPMWPSIITIRTPGTKAGIKNLAMENRLYVDFLDDPNFSKRERCWQKKRQVETFDENYERNRAGTNEAPFERALELVLRSDATTQMPKFSRGTLPLEYDGSVAESVESRRKKVGNRLWYQQFTHSKDRHMLAHVYDRMEKEEEGPSSNESALEEKIKIGRPRTSATVKENITTARPKKKKRLLLGHQVSVKTELESPEEVPYELEPLERRDESANSREKVASLKKKRRLRVDARPIATTVANKTSCKNSKRSASPRGNNVVSVMPRHSTVTMNEIIVDDDLDSDEKGIVRRKLTRKSRSEAAPKKSKGSASSRSSNAVPHRVTVTIKNQTSFHDDSDSDTSDFARRKLARKTSSDAALKKSKRSVSPRDSKAPSSIPLQGPVVVDEPVGDDDLDYSSDTKALTVQALLDNGVNFDSDSKVNSRLQKFDTKAKDIVTIDSMQELEEKASQNSRVEEKSEGVLQHFCVMRAGLKGVKEVGEDDMAKLSTKKKTVMSVPRKLEKPAKEAMRTFTSSTDSMLRISPPPVTFPSTGVVSSSDGFSMGKWFQRSLFANFMGTKTCKR